MLVMFGLFFSCVFGWGRKILVEMFTYLCIPRYVYKYVSISPYIYTYIYIYLYIYINIYLHWYIITIKKLCKNLPLRRKLLVSFWLCHLLDRNMALPTVIAFDSQTLSLHNLSSSGSLTLPNNPDHFTLGSFVFSLGTSWDPDNCWCYGTA